MNEKVVINNAISDVATLERKFRDMTENIDKAARKSIPLKEMSSMGEVEMAQELKTTITNRSRVRRA